MPHAAPATCPLAPDVRVVDAAVQRVSRRSACGRGRVLAAEEPYLADISRRDSGNQESLWRVSAELVRLTCQQPRALALQSETVLLEDCDAFPAVRALRRTADGLPA